MRVKVRSLPIVPASMAAAAAILIAILALSLSCEIQPAKPVPSGTPPPPGSPIGGQIIADHRIVDRFDDIPARYLAAVKGMSLIIPGESHSAAYRDGLVYLETLYPDYAVTVSLNSVPDPYPAGEEDSYLRVGTSSCGESDWYASDGAIAGMRGYLDSCNSGGRSLSATGFGWCWDMSWINGPAGTVDPVYNVHWAGTSVGGPEGDRIWGLDAEDFALTGNSVCMDTYLNATQNYADYCASSGYPTVVMLTTGPVDGYDGENGYQRQLKQDRIRQFAAALSSRVLFDYADILAWNDAGEEHRETWVDGGGASHSYQMIHDGNMQDIAGMAGTGHIGSVGAVRIAKALWWTMARLAGWNGTSL